MKKASGSRTLLLSVLLSAPGPLVVGLGLMSGRSATQLADFFRRSAELLAILCAYAVYRATTRDGMTDEGRKKTLERRSNVFVAAMMCLSGAFMMMLALLSDGGEKGNVLPGLTIAVLGVIANTMFFFKYRALNRRSPNAILAVQSRLYGAKSLVDACVCAALLSVALFPASPVSAWMDRLGSLVVAAYLMRCGIRTFTENRAG